MQKTKIKIGIILDDSMVAYWQYKVIKKLINSNFSTINSIIYNKKKSIKKKSWKTIVYRLYTKLDRRLYKVAIDAFSHKDITPLINNIEDKKDVAVDILVNFSSSNINSNMSKSSKYGVLAYREAIGFWEVMYRLGTIESTLEILSDNLHPRTIYTSSSKTDRFSVFRNINTSYLKAISFLPRKVEELYNIGENAFFKKVNQQNSYPVFYDKSISDRDFSNFKVFKLIIKHFIKVIKEKINNKFYFNQWILLFNFKENSEISTSFHNFTKIIPPKDKFYADPFVVYEKGKYYIFLEELMYNTNRGHLSVIEINKDGSHSEPTKILETPYHLSYPSIVKNDKDYFLIPESKSNRTIQLYKCIEFPYKWEFQMNLMKDIDAVDATLFFYENRWWMFCNIVENRGAASFDELFLFYADELETDKWTAHPLNPIVSDTTKSRPAGDIFIYNNKLIRPSQNCSFIYGYGIKMNEILVLNEHEYQEVEINSIEPNWEKNIISTHTYSHANGLTVIDAGLKRRK